MKTRTIGALALRPTGNVQGGHYFLSLVTGRVLNRAHVTPLTMNELVKKKGYTTWHDVTLLT